MGRLRSKKKIRRPSTSLRDERNALTESSEDSEQEKTKNIIERLSQKYKLRRPRSQRNSKVNEKENITRPIADAYEGDLETGEDSSNPTDVSVKSAEIYDFDTETQADLPLQLILSPAKFPRACATPQPLRPRSAATPPSLTHSLPTSSSRCTKWRSVTKSLPQSASGKTPCEVKKSFGNKRELSSKCDIKSTTTKMSKHCKKAAEKNIRNTRSRNIIESDRLGAEIDKKVVKQMVKGTNVEMDTLPRKSNVSLDGGYCKETAALHSKIGNQYCLVMLENINVSDKNKCAQKKNRSKSAKKGLERSVQGVEKMSKTCGTRKRNSRNSSNSRKIIVETPVYLDSRKKPRVSRETDSGVFLSTSSLLRSETSGRQRKLPTSTPNMPPRKAACASDNSFGFDLMISPPAVSPVQKIVNDDTESLISEDLEFGSPPQPPSMLSPVQAISLTSFDTDPASQLDSGMGSLVVINKSPGLGGERKSKRNLKRGKVEEENAIDKPRKIRKAKKTVEKPVRDVVVFALSDSPVPDKVNLDYRQNAYSLSDSSPRKKPAVSPVAKKAKVKTYKPKSTPRVASNTKSHHQLPETQTVHKDWTDKWSREFEEIENFELNIEG